MQSNEPVAPTFMDTINWLMGCNGAFERPKDAHEFWWRNELISRLNIKFVWDLRKYIARDEVAPTLMQEVETHRKELIFENQKLRQDNAQLQYALEQSESKWLKVAEPVAEDRTAADFCECGHPFGSHRIDGCSIASCNCLHSYRQSAAPELKGQEDDPKEDMLKFTHDFCCDLTSKYPHGSKGCKCLRQPVEPVPSPAQPAKWHHIHSIDEMEAYYASKLPAIRAAARECGYAIGVHGSMRRDLDLIAMPWRESPKDKEYLAKEIHKAASGGFTSESYQWERKPHGRYAASFPICWTEWHDMVSAGHIDLSVIAAQPEETTK